MRTYSLFIIHYYETHKRKGHRKSKKKQFFELGILRVVPPSNTRWKDL